MSAIKIGGLQPVTASDFPGCLAATVFCQGCNFRCPFCHNHSLLDPAAENRLDQDEVLAFLAKRQGLLAGVVISGGEPCLQPGLARFCQQLKEMDFLVKLDTNGSKPETLALLLDQGLVDFVAMDIKAPLARLPELTGTHNQEQAILQSIELIAHSRVEHLFRTTDVTPLLGPKDHQAIKELVPAGSRHISQPFIASHALAPSLRGAAAP